MSVKQVANIVKKKTGYLYNYTHEELAPGVIVRASAGKLHVVGHVTEWFEGKDLEQVQASLGDGERPVEQEESVRSGLTISLTVDGSGTGNVPNVVNGKFGATLAFGVGGGVVFDVAKEATVSTLGVKRRFLLQHAVERLAEDHLLVEEVVSSGYVAASATGFGGKLKLSVDGSVDPASVGLGNLAELKIAGKLELSVEGGSAWQRSRSAARPLFKAVKVQQILDVLGTDLDKLPPITNNFSVEDLAKVSGAKKQRVLASAGTEDLAAYYGPSDEE